MKKINLLSLLILLLISLMSCEESTVTEPNLSAQKLNGTWFLDSVNDSTSTDSLECASVCGFIFNDLNNEVSFIKNDSNFYKTKYELKTEDNVEVLVIKRWPFPLIISNNNGNISEVYSDYKFIINFANDNLLTLNLISPSVTDNFKIEPLATYKRRK